MGYIKRQDTGAENTICVKENKFTGDITIVTRDFAANVNSGSEREICCLPIRVDLRGQVETTCRCANSTEYADQVRKGRGELGDPLPYRDTPDRGTIDCPTTTLTGFSFKQTTIEGWCDEVSTDILDGSPGVPALIIPDCPIGSTTKDVNISIDVPEVFQQLTSRQTDIYGYDCPPYNNRDYQDCPCQHSSEFFIRPNGDICYYCENSLERYICHMTTLGCSQFEGGPRGFELGNIVKEKLRQEGLWDMDCGG